MLAETDLGLGLAGIALLVALASLYVGQLKRADVQIIDLQRRPVGTKGSTRRDEGPPIRALAVLQTAVLNTGARSGVLTDLRATRVDDSLMSVIGCTPDPNWRDGVAGAKAIAGGESIPMVIELEVEFKDVSVDAWRTGSFTSFEAELTYTYIRGRRFRRAITRTLRVPVPLEGLVAT